MKKTMTLINAWDTMLDLILSFFGDKLEWDEETLRYLSSKEEFEYEEIQLMKPIYVDSEQTIDAILFFNDGTIEFHLTSCEAYNWTNYGISIIDVSILRLSLPDINLQSVFDQMRQDRQTDIDTILAKAEKEERYYESMVRHETYMAKHSTDKASTEYHASKASSFAKEAAKWHEEAIKCKYTKPDEK